MRAVETGRSVVRTVREENVPFMAASVAYYTLASVVPLLAIALVVLGAFGATDVLIDALRSNLSESGEAVLRRVLTNADGRGAAGVLGLLFTLWSASKVFQGISIAFDEVYGSSVDDSLAERIGKSLLVFGLLLGAVVLLSAAGVAHAYVRVPVPYPALLGNLLALLALVLAILPLYYVLPPVPVSVRHALPGTVFAAVGWVVLRVAFGSYVGAAGDYAAYGLLGGVLLLLTVVYLGGVVLLVGAVCNVVLEAGPTVTRSPTGPATREDG